jgi:calcium permeable stress-gated cation channel
MKKCARILLLLFPTIDILFRYFLFLFVNVVFIFLLASTYWQLLRDLANSPSTIPERIAQALAKGTAK